MSTQNACGEGVPGRVGCAGVAREAAKLASWFVAQQRQCTRVRCSSRHAPKGNQHKYAHVTFT